MIRDASANLRVSYLGGGSDYPQFFKDHPVTILTEGLPVSVVYNKETGKWESLVGMFIRLYQKDWSVEPIETDLHKYRRLYDAEHKAPSQLIFLKQYRHLLKPPGVMLKENVEDYDAVLDGAKDPSLHLIDVPYRIYWSDISQK